MKYMVYNFGRRNHAPATIWTRDGVVTCATPAYQWAIGQTFDYLQRWWVAHDRVVKAVGTECMPPAGFLKHQIAPLRSILYHVLGPAVPQRRPALEMGGRQINLSRDRSPRLWKKLLQQRFPGEHPYSIHALVRQCIERNDHFFTRKRWI